MARGNVIDQAAMMRAGFGRTSKGINPAANQHNKFWEKAATVVGSFAQKQIEQSFENLQEFKKQTDGQVGALNLMAIDAPSFLGDIKGVKKAYDKGARMASLGLTPQRRANGREIMAKYMAQLQKMSQYDKAFESSIPGSTAKTARLTGRSVPDGIESTARHNPGNTRSEILNTSEQANGRMKKLMRWDIDTGKMMIMRGGEWKKNEDTGEDEYVGFSMEAETEEAGAEVWSEPTEVAYDDLRFGGAEDNLLQNKMAEIGLRLTESATDSEFNGMWELHKENLQSELHGFLNSEEMDENAFKDFYFGGFSYDYSNNRMTASAPAFQLLLEQDIIAKNWSEKDGWKDGFGPGTKDWITKLEVLKRQNFSAGSKFRTDQEPKLLQTLTDKYDHARRLYENYERSKPRKGGGGGGGGGGGPKYKNRNVDIDMFLHKGEGGRSKITTTSDAMIGWDEDLQAMEKTGKDSMSNEAYVNINGVKYGFVPGQGFKEVEDISASYGLSYKHGTRYFKTPEDIFKYHDIPTTYIGTSGADAAELD